MTPEKKSVILSSILMKLHKKGHIYASSEKARIICARLSKLEKKLVTEGNRKKRNRLKRLLKGICS